MAAPAVAVTGSTGALGGMLAQRLADAGIAQRLLVRTPSRAPELPGATVHPFSYSDREASARALDGVETLFMVSASESESRARHRCLSRRTSGRRPRRAARRPAAPSSRAR